MRAEPINDTTQKENPNNTKDHPGFTDSAHPCPRLQNSTTYATEARLLEVMYFAVVFEICL